MSELFKQVVRAHAPAVDKQEARHPQPTLWKRYFDDEGVVQVPERALNVHYYRRGSEGAAILCLHGGGYSGLTWSLVARKLSEDNRCQVFAPDLRGHGKTASGADEDLAAETLAEDVAAFWKGLGLSADTPLVVLGHSMGGAIAVRAAHLISKGSSALAGVAVVDVVEGTALAALGSMRGVLAARPAAFASLEEALDWARSSHMVTNREAAAVSLPAMLRWQAAPPTPSSLFRTSLDPISESGSEDDEKDAAPATRPAGAPGAPLPPRPPARPAAPAAPRPAGVWAWRTPLADSAPHWAGWYQGLSDAFLALPCPKILILAGTDRLDKALTIGQMQGKFQLALLPQAGHAIQEDAPTQVADTVSSFLKRFRVGEGGVAFHSHLEKGNEL
ncbi:hypothetical protein QBZ16_001347 [Prototheca wickerhamii]|uniref:Protein phosphatase methylesterase 1 n=1 Tax=Prototheca wickerhamii TaxID=3111 RepID=A0AAD9IDF1_PROWI|nr:hypothetical protein QBZ16_001347 [Prototheca wickerhamii]